MSEKTPEGPDLDATTEQSVRRLLADARHTEPLPPEVAARLDSLLGELVEARSAETGVSSIAARRSRRRGLFLVAAAAAVVVGIAVPAITRSSDDTTSTASDAGSSSSDASGQTRSELAQAPSAAPSAASSAAAGDQAAPAPAAKALPTLTLTSDDLEAEVRSALLPLTVGDSAYSSTLSLLPDGCTPPVGTAYAFLFPATYDGREAFLGADLPRGGSQEADLYLCGEPAPVRSVTVEVPR